MTTGIPGLDYLIAWLLFAHVLALLIFGRRWFIRHTGRAKALPDLPERDEASAPEGVVVCESCGERINHGACHFCNNIAIGIYHSPMQRNSEPREWPKHSFDERLPRRAAE